VCGGGDVSDIKYNACFNFLHNFCSRHFLYPINILGNAPRNESRSSCMVHFIAVKQFNQNVNMKMNLISSFQ
jgi:hypothetical protein